MADDTPKLTTRRDHILSFVPKAARVDALRVFEALDKGEPPAPPKPPAERPKGIAQEVPEAPA